MTAQSPELLNQINEWRQKSALGTLTLDECREAVRYLRAGRMATTEAAQKAKSGTKKAKAPPKAVDDMFNELEAL